MAVLIDVPELRAELAAGDRIVLLDVRWALGDDQGHARYLAGHLPGAVYVDLETELADPPSPERGRHPLPDPARFQAAARRWGLRDGDEVVAYDATGNLAAARAWWLLRWAGHQRVRLLDGGLAAWVAAGGPVEAGAVEPAPGTVILQADQLPVLTADTAADRAHNGLLLDARAAERYRGEVEPIDPRAGHIPGAVNAPTAQTLDTGGRFLPAGVLADRFAALGAAPGVPVGVYCGSGVTAAHLAAALAVAGIDADLYPGSWSQWSADPSRPVAIG